MLFASACQARAADWPNATVGDAVGTPNEESDSRHSEPKTLDAVQVRASPLGGTAEQMSQPAEVLSGEALDAAKAATLGETVGQLPGVQSSNFGAGVGRPIVRGLDGARVAVVSNGMSVQDVSAISQDHSVAIEPFLADQIEVLKGPATLLYGTGAIGGVVNVVDGRIAEQALGDAFSGRSEARYDSVNDGYTGMFRVDAMGAGDALVFHADGLYRNQGDYDTPLGVQRNSAVDTQTGAVGASWVGVTGFLGASAARYESTYGNAGEPGDPTAGEPGVNLAVEQNRLEAKGGIVRAFGMFTGARASVARTDYELTEFEGDTVGTRFVNQASEGRLELVHRPFGRWSGAFGVQGSDRTFEAIGEEAFVPRSDTRAMGVFLTEQGAWQTLQVDVGARIDRIEIAPVGGTARTFKPVSVSAGVLWHATEAWRLSANLDSAERAPAEEELFANGPHVATASFEIGSSALQEERARQMELGVHYHGQRIEAKASVYRTRFDGFIYLTETSLVRDDLPVRMWSQADATFRGAEAELIAHLVDGDAGALDLRVFGDRVRATLDDRGGNLPRVVPARVGVEVDWRAAAWRASIGAVRYARQDDVAQGETPTRGYTMVDAHVAYHIDRDGLAWEVFLDGTNLTDQEARVHTSFLKDTVVLPGRGVAAGVRIFF